jgi:glycosyltransferase involved in cell wall biosynthesis
MVAHFFLRGHIQAFKNKFNVTLAHNTNIDRFCPSVADLCQIQSISIQRKITPFRDIWTMFQIIILIIKIQPKIVISVTPKSGLLTMIIARLLGVRVRLHIFQGEIWPNRTGIMKQILLLCDSLIIKSSTHLLCVSDSERKLLQNTFTINPSKIEVLGYGSICGVKPQFFVANSAGVLKDECTKHELEGFKVCAYFGRICEEKGIRDLINAFCLLDHSKNDKKLVLIGPEENFSIVEEVKKKPKNIQKLIVTYPFTDKPEEILPRADFLCLPSYREGFGLSILEAAAMGIPSIGTRIVGISDAIIENETGLLCKPRNPDDLAKCMELMFDDDILRQRLGSKARDRAEKYFRQADVVSRYSKFVNDLI